MAEVIDDGARQRIYNAVGSLSDARPIKERLHSASLQLLPLQPRDFPLGDQRDLFEEIMAGMTKVSGPATKGYLSATLDAMNDQMAQEISAMVVKLLYLTERARST